MSFISLQCDFYFGGNSMKEIAAEIVPEQIKETSGITYGSRTIQTGSKQARL